MKSALIVSFDGITWQDAVTKPMTSKQFNAALNSLDLSQLHAGLALGIDARTVRRYAAGDARVPVTLAKLLRLAIAGKITVNDIAKA